MYFNCHSHTHFSNIRLIDSINKPKDLINAAIEIEEKENNTKQVTEWENMMRNAIQQSQNQSFKMYQTGTIENSVFEKSVDTVVESYEDDGSIPLDFFSSINGM